MDKKFFKCLSRYKSSESVCEYFKLPINLIFLKFNFFKYSYDSLLEDRHRLKFLNIFFEKFENWFHLSNVFFVILPFNKYNWYILFYLNS